MARHIPGWTLSLFHACTTLPARARCGYAADHMQQKTRIYTGLVAITTMSLLTSHLTAGEPLPAVRLQQTARPLVIGHRGYNAFAPENTLPSFKLAKAAGVDLVELDYQLSQDRVPVVIHDSELDRTTDAVAKWGAKKIRLESRTFAQLRELDAGKWFDPTFAGTRLLRLEEALDFIQADGGVTLIERKSGDASACAQLLRGRNWINRVVLQSFEWDFLRDFHAQVPEQILGALGPPGWRGGKKLTDEEKTLSPQWISEAKRAGASVIGWNKLVTRDAIADAHRQGLKVWIYTVNDIPEANGLLDLGVDGIITDNPSLIWRALALRGFQRQ
jgi:glycerophosphoryl diester phosphodiesterase